MPDVRAQIILKTDDAVPENFLSNSWCLTDVGAGPDNTAITAMFKTFYDSWTGSYGALNIAQNGHVIKLSLLPGVKPNYPFHEGTFNLAANPNGSQLPAECAVCISMAGQRSAGLPQARRRGRVYIGPLAIAANSDGRPATAFINSLSSAMIALKASAATISGGGGLAIWSTTDQSAVVVENGWIDNAWDVQRRRGLLPTSRTTFG